MFSFGMFHLFILCFIYLYLGRVVLFSYSLQGKVSLCNQVWIWMLSVVQTGLTLMIFLPQPLKLELQAHYVCLVKILIQDVLHIRKMQVEPSYDIQ